MNRCLICNIKTKVVQNDLKDDRYGCPGGFSIFECKNCTFAQLSKRLSKSEITKIYSKYYQTKNITPTEIINQAKSRHGPFWAWFLGTNNTAHYNISKSAKFVLDIGCGTGASVLELKNLGLNASGIDPDPSAKRNGKALNLNIETGFVDSKKLKRNFYDVVTASQVIEHTPNPIYFLKKCKTLINKNGKIIISMPNYDSIFRKVFSSKWINWHVPYHQDFFTKKSIKIVAKKCKLKISSIKTITPNLWTAIQLRSMIPVGNVWQDGHTLTSFATWALQYFLVSNRVIDYFGFGDSLLVVLTHND